MSLVISLVTRLFVDDLDKALPTYIELSGNAEVRRFSTPDGDVALAGQFLLLQIPEEERDSYIRQATVYVTDIDAVAAIVTRNGGQIIEGPAMGEYGSRMLARHVDGAVYEYNMRVG